MQLHTIKLNGAVVPKARPRVTTQGTFMPKRYTTWKAGAILDCRMQYKGETLDTVHSVSILLTGKYPRSGDCDNISGAVLDTMVQAEVIKNDNLTVVPRLLVELHYRKDLPAMAIVTIKVK